MTAPTAPAPAASAPTASTADAPRFPVARVAYLVVLALSLLVALVWLGVGAVVAAVRYLPGLAASAAAAGGAGNAWAAAFADSAHRSEPLSQLLVDYGLSAVNFGLALVLLLGGGRSWSIRLLALAMVGSAGAFNLQAHAAAPAVMEATGFSLGEIHQIVLHGIACAAFILALLVFPSPRYPGMPAWIDARAGRALFATVGVLALGLVGFGTALLPHTASCVVFFGVLVPVVGLVVLPRRIRQGATGEQRTQARLVFALLVAAFAAIVVLGVVTIVLWQLGMPGLSVYDPTVHGATPDGAGEPIALLFWSSRLGAAAIAGAMFIAARADGLWRAERLFGRGLAGVLAIASGGGGFVLVEALAKVAGLGDWVSCLVAALPTAVAFLPIYRLAERITDRLLYGERPSPYAALAEVTAISRATAAEGPDLARIPEAVGRAVGATECRLTVLRPGLRDRIYRWSASGGGGRDDDSDLLVVPIRSGEREMGAIAVDRGAFAGLQAERRRLLEDIADSLGVVVAANRLGIELERQLRAALAHAAEIAASRRQAVSEMDRERRRVERDLHDGAQHQLVSLRLVLGLVEHEVDSGRLESAAERLGVLAGQLDTAEAVLAETASGVRSMALVEQGLVAALETELCGPHTMVTVESTLAPGRRYPPELEAAVYFCCLESVNNAHKHAPGAAVVLRFAEADGRLLFSVRDEGPGFEVPDAGRVGPQGAGAGRGLRNVVSRIVAAGGRVDLRSAPGQGTTVEGSVPVPPPPEDLEPEEPPTDVLAEVEASLDGKPVTPSGPLPAVRLSGPVEFPGLGDHMTTVSVVDPDALTTAVTQLPTGFGPAAPQGEGVRPPAGPPAWTGTPPAGLAPRTGTPPVGPPARSGTTQVEPAPRTLSARPSTTRPAVRPAVNRPLGPEVSRPAAAALPGTLLGAVQAAATEARAVATGAGADLLDDVLRGLVRPLRIGVTGPPGSGVSTLVRALTEVVAPVPDTVIEEVDAADPAAADELVLVLEAAALPGGPGDGLAQQAPGLPPAIGVLARADLAPPGVDPWQEAQRLAAEPAVRRVCHTVLPVAALLATGGAGISPADAAELRHSAGSPPSAGPRPGAALAARLGPTGVRLAAELAAQSADPSWIGAELVRRSGVLRLRELLAAEIGGRADLLRARAALRALETVSGALPPEERTRLRYQLDRIRSGAHELVELDLLDRLRTDAPPMADDERAVAERLLGASGRGPHERLGLPPGATAADVRMSAAAQLSRWQQRAGHPLSTADTREAAGVLVRTCERLIALAATPAEPAPVPAGDGAGSAASAVSGARPSSGR